MAFQMLLVLLATLCVQGSLSAPAEGEEVSTVQSITYIQATRPIVNVPCNTLCIMQLTNRLNESVNTWLYTHGAENLDTIKNHLCASPTGTTDTIQAIDQVVDFFLQNTVPGEVPGKREPSGFWDVSPCDTLCQQDVKSKVESFLQSWIFTHGAVNVEALRQGLCSPTSSLNTYDAFMDLFDVVINNRMPTTYISTKSAWPWWMGGVKPFMGGMSPAYDWTPWMNPMKPMGPFGPIGPMAKFGFGKFGPMGSPWSPFLGGPKLGPFGPANPWIPPFKPVPPPLI